MGRHERYDRSAVRESPPGPAVADRALLVGRLRLAGDAPTDQRAPARFASADRNRPETKV
ncbi:hypothetical protein BRC78_09245 [Halobacteriales archaeon QH_8_68_33]|nr:MAG: hypothetical protein BRC78_09245 [Halobacteriales archaeon QH_8_68_33]